MATTQLSPSALPGKPYSFIAKSGVVVPHTGLFTELSVTATPGPRHAFSPKDSATPGIGDHTGLFTELSVIALPGMRHSFTAKTAAAVEDSYGTGRRRRKSYIYEEKKDDIFEMVQMIIASGAL